jgi:transcription elongation GreA/GreB family factor
VNKPKLINKIIAQLITELEVYFKAANAARAEATHEQSKPENKYDTRGLEASYLARGQSRHAAEIQLSIEQFRLLPGGKLHPTDPIDVGALVELEGKGGRALYFIGPRAGGTEVVHEKREVLVITPQSPLGAQLAGKKQGDVLRIEIAGAHDEYRVVSVS